MNNDTNTSPTREFYSDIKKFLKILSVLIMILALFVAVAVISSAKSFKYIGQEHQVQATISFSGEGEVFAVPDTASFSFTVTGESETAQQAQADVAERMNSVLASLEEMGIEDRDIKTTGYNLYPRYDYISPEVNLPRPGGTRTLVGYEASHSVSVKVRDIDEAGNILSQVGGMNVSNISSLNFIVEDEDRVVREARQLAIDEAKDKARDLSRDLGVRLVRIVDFQEQRDGFSPFKFDTMESAPAMAPDSAPAPSIPTGENRIFSRVNITYEIR